MTKISKYVKRVAVASILISGLGTSTAFADEINLEGIGIDNVSTIDAEASKASKASGSYYTQDKLSLRTTAKVTSKNKVLDIPKNKKITVTSKVKAYGVYWYKTSYKGKKGWVSGKYLAKTKVKTSKVSKVSNELAQDEYITQGLKYIGTPYVWGGTTARGLDCSGYVYRVLNDVGYKHSRLTSGGYYNKSKHLSASEAEPGDLVFFSGNGRTITHVAFYYGNGKLLHAAGKSVKISYLNDGYWNKRLVGYGRIK